MLDGCKHKNEKCDDAQCVKCQFVYNILKDSYTYQIISQWKLAHRYCDEYDDMWYILLACERLAEERNIKDILKYR